MDSKRRPGRSQRAPLIEELEPRLLLSADLPIAAPDPGAPAPELVVTSDRIDMNRSGVGAEAAPTSALRREIAFVDAGVEGYQDLVADLIGRRNAELQLDVFVLDAERDGIDQIGDVLARYAFDVDAVHVLSHGNDRGVQLGATWLSDESVASRTDAIAGWRSALTADADLLLYGCNLAGSSVGLALVDTLANLTGADVAASTDLTGHAALGGDWRLEYQTGDLETSEVLGPTGQAQWMGLLTITTNSNSSTATPGAAASLSWPHTVVAGSDRALMVGVSLVAGQSTSVTYGGTPLTLVGRYTGSFGHTTELWQLNTPAVGAANIVATFDASREAIAGGVAFNGVYQGGVASGFQGASADSNTPSVTVVSAPGELVIDTLFVDLPTTAGADPSQAEQWELTNGRTGAGSSEPGAAFVTMSWSLGSADEWNISAASLKPAAPFQEGVDGYVGTEDTRVTEDNPALVQGSDTTLRVDASAGTDDQGLIRFGNIFGSGPGQIPLGSTIHSASLTFEVTDASAPGATIGLHRMLSIWDENSTWTSTVGGIQLDDVEANSVADSVLASPDTLGQVTFTGLEAALQSWSDGAANQGWAIVSDSSNGWVAATSEHPTPALRPALSVTYTPPPTADVSSDLVVHLTLDETSGATATDRSGNGNDGSLTGTQTWTPATVSGGFQFDYTDGDDYFEIANSSTVENVQEGDFTLAAWVQAASTPPGTGSDNDANYAIIVKEGFHNGIYFGNDNRFHFDSVLVGDVSVGVTTTNTFVPGSFYHVAGVLDRAAGTLEIYVDGALEGTANFTPGTASREYGTDTWKVGMAGQPGWGTYKWAADATIDDVRIYARALSETDVQGLAAMPDGAALWLTSEDDVASPSDVPGADSWSGGAVLELGGSPTLEPGTTGGTFSSVFDLDAFVQDGDSRLDAIHYVGSEMLLGTNQIAVQTGDVLLSSVFPETLVNSDTSTVPITSRDVVIYRPDTAGDYAGGGTFIPLIVGADLAIETEGVTLVEQTVTVGAGAGATTLQPGEFLFTDRNDTGKIFRLTPGVLGDAATNTGTITTLVDANNLGVNQEIHGVEIIESAVTVGDRTLYGGQILISTYADDTISGTPTERDDVVLLDITSTGPGAATTGSAEVLFQGAEMGFDAWQESIWGVALRSTVTTNAAPVLTPGSPSLTAITEDDTGNGGDLVSAIVSGTVSDGDGNDVGIAITGLTSGNGTWQYSLDGGSVWNAVGTVGANSALLLRHTDLLRFVPDGANGESPDPTVTYRAWDQTSGAAGTLVDPGAGGGASAFSAAVDTASIAVSSVPDLPVASDDRRGLRFDGVDDYVSMGPSAALSLPNTLTVEAWVRPDSYAPVVSIIVNKEGEYELGIHPDGSLRWAFANTDPGWAWHDTGYSVPLNEWTHVAVSFDSGTILTYANGVLVDSYAGSGAIVDVYPGLQEFRVGARENNPADQYFDGEIDEVRVWSDVRTPGEIAANWEQWLDTATETNLAGYWRFEEGSGTTTQDLSVNGNDGTLGDGVAAQEPTWVGYDVDEDTLLSVPALTGLLANDFDPDVPETLNVISVDTTGTLGSVVWAADGSFDYDPSGAFDTLDAGETVIDSFEYTIEDSLGATDTATAYVTVRGVNDAPTLGNGSLAAVDEDTASPPGDTIANLFGAGFADPDGTFSGVAVTGNGALGSEGVWQYASDGTNWFPIGVVDDTSLALALQTTTWLRFVPAADFSGAPTDLVLRGLDDTYAGGWSMTNAGESRATVATGTRGDPTAIAAATSALSTTINPINDAPVLAPATPSFTAITEDETGNVGNTVASLLGASVTDADGAVAEGIAVTGLAAGGGTWQFRLGAGAWTDVGAVSATSALLLRDTDSLRFVPDGDNGESPDPTLSYRAWDQDSGVAGTKVNPGAGGGTTAFSTVGDTASITVSSVNDAPVLVGVSPTLTGITEDDTTNGGDLVSTLLGGVSDVDTAAASGLAITSVTAVNGTWQYRLGAGAWTDVGAVSATSALLLASTDSVRFVPDGDNGGSSSFTFRAWDQTTGVAGTKVDPGVGGTTTAFSTGGDTAGIMVTSVNDAPILVGVSPTLTGITEDDTTNGGDLVSTLLGGVSDVDTAAASGLAITSVTAVNGTWQYRLGAGAWTDVGAVSATSALLLASTDSVRFVPDGENGGSSSFTFRAWDQTTGVAGTKVDPGVGGTTTAFSTGGDTAGITVTSVNDAPVLVGVSPTLTGITEDDTTNGGDLVSTLLGGVSDVDTGAASGLAITSVTAVNGIWQYRLGAGAWTDVGVVSATSALLLASTDSVRFVPDGDNGGSSSFTFRAWDQTTGVAGTKVDPGVGGTTTAFSTGSDSAGITVTSVNDAPILVGVSPTLTGISEDDTTNSGDLVSTLLGGVSDVDTGAASGLAITSVTAVNGTWQYRLGAGAWTDVGAVSATSALLLASTDSVRFVPDGDNGGSSSFTFRAWDQTTGVAGTKVDPGIGGTTTAFSTGGDSAGITVTSVNDAPVLVGVGPTLTGITEDDTGNSGDLVSTLLGGVSDVDTGAASGLAITSVTAVNGTWQYRLGAGAWTDVGAVSATSALLLASTDSVRFVPDADNGGSSSFDFRAWDQTTGVAGTKVDPGVGGTTTAFSTGSDTAGITVTSVNDAPVLVGVSPTLTGITEDDTGNSGDLVSTLLGGVSDVDTGAASGLAITSVTAVNGTWQYRLGAGAWTDVGTVSATSALLLASTDSVRFVPDGDNGGSSSFDFRAWDQTTGVAGTKIDPGVGGTTTAFSTGSDTADITVTSVNDAPVLVGVSPTLTGITEDDTTNGGNLVSTLLGGVSDVDTGAAGGLAITSVTEVNGTWQYRLGAGAWTDVGAVSATSALLLASTDSVRFVPDGDNGGGPSFTFRAWDQTTDVAGTKVDPGIGGTTTAFSTGGDTAGITVTSVNDAPVLVGVSPTLTSITEDDTGNSGDLVSTLLGGVSDVDTGAAGGLAITSVTEVNGTWQYRLGAGAWTDVGAVSATSALLLASTDSVRFVPDGDNGGSSSFDFRAWDQTTGVAGTKIDPGVGGTTTALSTGSDTAGITVTSVNDAPVLVGVSPTLTGITEDDTGNSGDLVSTLLGGVSDVDTGAASGLAITSVTAVNGTWQYRLGAGAWTDVGAVSATSALLLASTDSVRFVPDGDNGGSSSFDFRAWDQTTGVAGTKIDPGVGGTTTAFSTGSDTAGITVTSVNDAPVLVGVSPTLTGITEDDTGNSGDLVSTLLGGVSDVDTGAASGLAITSVTAVNGTWQYRLGAGAWTDVGAVSATSGLLLASTDSVRFVPDGDNGGSSSFDFRAWDQTTGVAGTKVDPGVGGTTTAFSTGSDTAGITVTSVNDAPALDPSGNLVLTDVVEDDTNPPGDTVATILASDGGNPLTDVDAVFLEGIAITGVDDTNGTWQYRLGAGAWTDVGTVSATSALLLRDTDGLRFVPDPAYNGSAGNVGFRGWDQTTGTAGTLVNPGVGGGTTAYSTLAETATLDVTAVNDAPVLTPASPTLTAVTEDDVANGGQTVSSIVGSSISDDDVGALEGIAITGLSASNGSWQYRVGAGAWTDIAPVTGTSALLLASSDSVRFVPDGLNAGSGTFSYRAWDQTTSSAGTKLDPGVGGGSTAFSTASDTASITTTAVNDAPQLVGVSPTLPGITEDDTSNGGALVSTLLGGVSDVDTGAASGLAITSLSEVNGTWQYRLGAGAWTDVGAVSATSALLLASTDSVRFVPDGDNGGSSSFDFRAWDQTTGTAGTQVDPGAGGGTTAFSTGSDTAGITVSSLNDAPVLVGVSPTLPGITEDDTGNGGALVSTLLGGVSDVDTGAARGLAITSATAVNGTWQYRLGAGAWTDVGAVSATSALLLASTDSVRFVPDGDNGGSSSFDFRAWDQTTGTAGTPVNPGAGGSTTAFSTGGDTASITVSSVNDAPVLAGVSPTLPSITEDDTGNGGALVSTLLGGVSDVDTGAARGLAITSATAVNGTWQYRLGAGAWTDVGAVSATSALLLASTDAVRFVPDGDNGGSSSFDFRAWDQTAGAPGSLVNTVPNGGVTSFSTATDTASITVGAVNDAPVLTAAAPSFPGITEDDTTNAGETIATLLGGSVGDVDSGALEGIALTGLVPGNGTWQYRVGAGAWIDVGAVSDANALVLQDTDRLRFLPDTLNGTNASVSYRAWDQSSGAAGSKVDASTTGGTTAFSTGTDTASIAVSDVNDPPTMADQGYGVDENAANGTVVGSALANDVDLPPDALTWTLLAGNTGGAFLVDAATGQIRVANTAALDFEANPVFNLTVEVRDPGGLLDTATLTVSLNDVPESVLIPDTPPPVDPPPEPSEPPPPEDDPGDDPGDDAVTTAPPEGEGDAPLTETLPPVSAPVPTALRAAVIDFVAEARDRHVQREAERLVALETFSLAVPTDDPLVLDAAMWEALDQLGRDFEDIAESDSATTQLLIGAAEGASVAIMAGFLSWFLRGGTLLTSLLTTMPLWSRLDPVPVLDTDDEERERLCDEADEADKGQDSDEQEKGARSVLDPTDDARNADESAPL